MGDQKFVPTTAEIFGLGIVNVVICEMFWLHFKDPHYAITEAKGKKILVAYHPRSPAHSTWKSHNCNIIELWTQDTWSGPKHFS